MLGVKPAFEDVDASSFLAFLFALLKTESCLTTNTHGDLSGATDGRVAESNGRHFQNPQSCWWKRIGPVGFLFNCGPNPAAWEPPTKFGPLRQEHSFGLNDLVAP